MIVINWNDVNCIIVIAIILLLCLFSQSDALAALILIVGLIICWIITLNYMENNDQYIITDGSNGLKLQVVNADKNKKNIRL
jgi:hypothetical protein